MKHLLHAVTAVIVIGACGVSLASAQTPEAVSVPEAQRALSLVMGKMVALASTASNTSHVDYLPLEKAMCAAIPSYSKRARVGLGWEGRGDH